ncbi:hypothetical protein OAP56_04825 [Rickettsiaceae bacterium]|nr:hypothetical protein [Rickettsiaceae bacterium]
MNNLEKRRWEGSIALSIFIHIIFILLFFFGLPSMFERFPEEKDVLTFEVVPLSSISNIKKESIVQKEQQDTEKSRLIKNARSTTQPVQNNKHSEQKQQVASKKAEQVPVKKVQPTKIKQAQKENKAVAKQQNKSTNLPKKEEDIIDSIWNNLEKESEGEDNKARKKSSNEAEKGKKLARSDEYNKNSDLSITEELYIKNKMKKYWRSPQGDQNISSVTISFLVSLAKGGDVQKVEVINRICGSVSSATCKLVEESAYRAIWQVSPFDQFKKKRLLELDFSPPSDYE